MTQRILEGIKVLDLTNVLSGPFTTLHLALLGAEVLKVENPKDGDLARKLGILPELNKRLMGTSFIAQNCNKKSITLNTKSAPGKAIFLRLAKDADVVVENFRPGVMDRLGLGYKVLSGINPGLVYCAISGFGQTGPDALNPAYDQIIQGLSGEMAVNGDERLNPPRAAFSHCHSVGKVIFQSRPRSGSAGSRSGRSIAFAVSQRQKARASYQLTPSRGWFQYSNSCFLTPSQYGRRAARHTSQYSRGAASPCRQCGLQKPSDAARKVWNWR